MPLYSCKRWPSNVCHGVANQHSSAGSETTASLLAGLTHWLLKTPDVFEKLKREIRTLESADDLVHENFAKMPYLNACIDEGLRIFPPVPGGNLRCVPKGGARVCGHDLPEGVSCVTRVWTVLRIKLVV